MAKVRTKQFTIRDSFQLTSVDQWWAGLLHGGMKEIVHVEWEALGDMMWRLRVQWQPVAGMEKLNVGHPRLSLIPTEHLEEALEDAVADFSSAFADYGHLGDKMQQWGVTVQPGDVLGTHRIEVSDTLDPAERIIAIEFLWPEHQALQKHLDYLSAQMNEVNREIQARKSPDYFTVTVERGMLRQAFVEQVGYDNEWLFEEAGGPFPHVEE